MSKEQIIDAYKSNLMALKVIEKQLEQLEEIKKNIGMIRKNLEQVTIIIENYWGIKMYYKCECGCAEFNIILRDSYLISKCTNKSCGIEKTWNWPCLFHGK